MTLPDIEQQLGEATVDALLLTCLTVISDDPSKAGYQDRLDALQRLLTSILALCAARSGGACGASGEVTDVMAARLRMAVGTIERRDIANREMGRLTDVPDAWRDFLVPRAAPKARKRLVQQG